MAATAVLSVQRGRPFPPALPSFALVIYAQHTPRNIYARPAALPGQRAGCPLRTVGSGLHARTGPHRLWNACCEPRRSEFARASARLSSNQGIAAGSAFHVQWALQAAAHFDPQSHETIHFVTHDRLWVGLAKCCDQTHQASRRQDLTSTTCLRLSGNRAMGAAGGRLPMSAFVGTIGELNKAVASP